MLLREFTVEDHTISLVQDGEIYIATVADKSGRKLFCHEYKDYDRIKGCFDEIVKAIEDDGFGIEGIMKILEHS